MTAGQLTVAGRGRRVAACGVRRRLDPVAGPSGVLDEGTLGRWPCWPGLAAAGVLAVVNLALLRGAPEIAGVRSIRRFYRDTLRPLFSGVGPRDVVVISAAAGVGEELLFRGALQAELGLAAASVTFGLLHIGGRDTATFGVWVMVMGAGLGWLAMLTGGLLAPIVAHAAYDAAAIAYCRWGPAVRRRAATRAGRRTGR